MNRSELWQIQPTDRMCLLRALPLYYVFIEHISVGTGVPEELDYLYIFSSSSKQEKTFSENMPWNARRHIYC